MGFYPLLKYMFWKITTFIFFLLSIYLYFFHQDTYNGLTAKQQYYSVFLQHQNDEKEYQRLQTACSSFQCPVCPTNQNDSRLPQNNVIAYQLGIQQGELNCRNH